VGWFISYLYKMAMFARFVFIADKLFEGVREVDTKRAYKTSTGATCMPLLIVTAYMPSYKYMVKAIVIDTSVLISALIGKEALAEKF